MEKRVRGGVAGIDIAAKRQDYIDHYMRNNDEPRGINSGMVGYRGLAYDLGEFARLIVNNLRARHQHESRQGNQRDDRIQLPRSHSTHQ